MTVPTFLPSPAAPSRPGRARPSATSKSRLRRLALDALEPRTLLATLPTPTVAARVDVSNAGGDESSPTIAVDPTDNTKAVAVWTRSDPINLPAIDPVIAQAAYSADGGKSWTPLTLPAILSDPNLGPPSPNNKYFETTDASVAFDRSHRFYISASEHDAKNLSGSIVLHKFDFTGAQPVLSAGNTVVHQWIGDEAFTPTLAVDAGVGNPVTSVPSGTPSGLAIGPDGGLYVGGLDINQVRKFDGTTGNLTSIFASGTALNQPTDLAFNAATGDLFVTNRQTGDVLRVDGATGATKGVFNSGLKAPKAPGDEVIGPDGFLYLSSRDTDSVLRYNATTGAFLGTFVAAGSGGLSGPEGLVFGSDGKLYVSSGKTDEVDRYDATTGAYVGTFVAAKAGGLSHPFGLTFGADGSLYVSSFNTGQVLRYAQANGAPLGVFASGNGLAMPTDLAYSPEDGDLYVESFGSSQLLRYSGSNGAFISDFLSSPTVALAGPIGLSFRPGHTLFVGSSGTNSVLVFNSQTGVFGSAVVPGGSGGLNTPAGLAFAADGSLLVSSRATNQVLRFSASGNFTTSITPQPIKTPRDATLGPDGSTYYAVSRDTDSVVKYDANTGQLLGTFVASGSGGLNVPGGLAFGPDGNLYVGSEFNNEVIQYNGTTGAFIQVWVDSKLGGLNTPEGLTFGADHNLYVSSTLTDEVLKYSGTIRSTFLGVFTPEPLKTPEGAILSPDGKSLFVASRDGNDIVRYDGKTGAFLGIFVAPKSGGLLKPRGLAIGADGNLYVSSFATDQVLKYDGGTGAPLGTFTPEPLKAPAGAVLSADGKFLYAASSGSDEVLKYDGTTGAFLGIFVPAGSGGLKMPEGLAIGPVDGNLYVASQGTDSVLEYSGSTGAPIGTFVAGGGALVQPEFLTFGPDGNLYVGSKATGEILKFNGTGGVFIKTFVAPGTGGLSGPEGLTFGPDGNLYVASRDTNQVLEFNGTSGATIGVFAAVAAGLTAPNGIAFGRDGNLYVSSKGDSRVLRFNGVTGAFRDAFVPTGSDGLVAPTGLTFAANGDLVVAGSGNGQLLRYDASVARSISTFTPAGANAPVDARGVVVGPDGNVYVASFVNNTILRYDGSSGAFLSTFVAAGLGGLDGPTAIAFDAAGNLYVASENNDKVLRYKPGGAFDLAFVAAGANGLVDPAGLTFDAAGDLLVSSSGTNQILRYNPAGAAFPSAGNTGATFINAGSNGPNGPEGLAIGPDSGLLTVASRFSNQVKFYNAATGALVRSSGGAELAEPRGLAYGLDGDVYVTSGANDEVIRYNGQTGALVEVFAATGLGGVSTPVGITFGRDRNLLVASSANDRVVTLSGANGASLGGFSPDPLIGPVGMRFGLDGNLYVTSRTGDKVLRYDPAGKFLGNFTPEPLKAPAGAVIGPDGNLYVASSTRNEVLHYTAAGAFLGVFVPTGSGGLATPSAIAFGPDGNLYVASTGTNSVLRYNGTTGTFFDVFVKPGASGPTDPEGLLFSGGNLFVGSKGSNQILRYNAVTGAPNPIAPNTGAIFVTAAQSGLRGPVGLALGPDGNLYVASSGSNEVYSYNLATAANVATFLAANAGGLSNPHDIAFSGGFLYVGSVGTNSVIRYLFTTPATFNTYVAPGLGGLANQSALLFDASGNLLLSSTGSNQVLSYAPNATAATSGVPLTPDGLSAPEDLQFVGSALLVSSFNTNEVLSYNASTGAQIGVFIAPGSGGLSGPQSLVFNGTSVFVTSSATNSVLQYDSTSGLFSGVFIPAGSGGLTTPQGLVFDPAISALLVSSFGTDEVIRYDSTTGALIGTFTSAPLKHPVGIKFGPDGKFYATSSTTDRVLRYNADGTFDEIFTSESLKGPEDAVLGPDGNLYVASQGTNEVLKYDGTTGAFLSTFVPKGSGGLSLPSGIAFDRSGNLLVTSKGTNQVLKYDKTTGASLGVFAAAGSDGLSAPDGIISGVFPDQNVYVSSSGSNAVIKYNGVTGAPLAVFTTGTAPTAPEGLTFSADGKSLFVASSGSNQVLQYDGVTGVFVKVFVAAAPITGPTAPRSIAFGPDGSLYVTSNGSDQVLRYSGATGQFLDAFVSKGRSGLSKPAGLVFKPDGTLLVASNGTDQILRFDANGNALGAFTAGPLRSPERLAFDAAGNLYVSSFGTNSVLEYNPTGLLQGNFVPPGGGTLSGPEGLVFTADGSLLVSSSTADDILRFAGGTGLFKTDLNPTRPTSPVDSTIGPDGLLYVSSRDSHSVVRYDPATGKLLGTFVAPGSGTLKTPGGLVFGPDGNLYVASEGTNQVLRFNGRNGVFLDVFADGTTGLSKPTGLTFGVDGNLYVASFNSNQVLRYKGTTGAFLSAFVTAGSGLLSGPSSLAFGPDGNLYVASQNTNAVNRYRFTNGFFLDSFVAPNSGGLDGPTNIAFDAVGNLLVASNSPVDQDNRVLKYSSAGAPLGTLVTRGEGGLLAPSGLAIAPDGSLYVSSRDTGRILKYVASSGVFVSALDLNPDTTGLTFGPDGNGDGVAELLVAGFTTDSVSRYDGRTGEYVDTFIAPRSGGLKAPTAVRVGPLGLIYVSSSGTNQVLKYDPTTGAFLGVAASGSGLSAPDGIAFDAAGTLYVSSRSSDQVLAYNPATGTFLRVAAAGNTLSGPRGLAIDAAGNLEVASSGGGNVLKFRPTDGSFLGVATQAAAPGFTDPDTAKAQNDPFSGNVYLAWATNEAVGLTDGKANLNPSAIVLVASSDGGKSFSAPTVVNDSKFRSAIELDAQPKITISQGTADGRVAPGQVNVAWDDFGSGNFLNPLTPPRDFLHADRVTPGVTASFSQAFPKTDNRGAIKSVTAPPATGPTVTDFKLPVNISDPRFTTIAHVDVHLNLTDADLTTLEVDLIGPDGTRVPLIRNPALHPGAPGLVGANLGGIESSQLDTIFDQQAPRTITDGTIPAPYIGRFQPDSQLANPAAVPPIPAGPTLDAFKGLGPNGANGFWTLEITDFSNKGTPFPAQRLVRWGLDISSGVAAGVDSNIGTTFVTGRLTGTKIIGVADSGPYDTSSKGGALTFAGATIQGIGPGLVLASDNTLGSFSPVEGRIYASYTQIDPNNRFPNGLYSDDTNIVLVHSDDGGLTWSAETQVNDDNSQTDGFSEAFTDGKPGGIRIGRPQFSPSIAVDQSTGTLALSFYDARNDPSRARVATYVALSIDGGATFAPETFANTPNTAADGITRQTITLGPIPDNQSPIVLGNPFLGNANSDALFGYGDHQGLAFVGGRLYPAWSGNEDGGPLGTNLLDIRVAAITTSAGPRVLTSTEGTVKAGSAHDLAGNPLAFNNTSDTNGSPFADGFLVTFDRAVDPATIGPANVHVTYRDVNTSGFAAGTNTPVLSVTPLLEGNTAQGPTKFLVRFAKSSATGTYSYAVGPSVRDRVRTVSAGAVVRGNLMDQNGDGVGGEDPSTLPFTGNAPGDIYAVPTPLPVTSTTFAGTTYTPPYDRATQPLIVPGPHLVGSFVPGKPATIDNLVTDSVVSTLALVFDRDIDPASLDGTKVLRIFGPAGKVAGPFTVALDPAADANHPRIFDVKFPAQQLSGNYVVTLASTIAAQGPGGLAAEDKLDTNQNAGLDVLRGDPSAGTSVISYNSSDQIPPVIGGPTANLVATTKIVVPDNFVVQALTITLNLTYPNDPDLTATLVAPDGTSVQLFTGVGAAGSAQNFTNTTFNDLAATPIQNGGAPFFGSYNPQFPLTAFKGHDSAGTWTLRIADKVANKTGTLNGFSLNISKPLSLTGLGEPVADQATASFRIFTLDPANPLASNAFTAVGPSGIGAKGAGLNAEVSGRVSSLTVDPSDPSGNTVYVGSASGGVWKTSNFLTTSAAGPTYVPLTDFGPTFSLNVGGIAAFGRNNDPTQTTLFVGTGEGDTLGYNPQVKPTQGDSPALTTRGVGFLKSTDGGATWLLLDSTVNTAADGTPLPISSPLRDHAFVGTTTFKVVVDPKPTPTGDVIIYAALSDVEANGLPVGVGATREGGLWRSVDSGRTWQQLRAGQATDIVLDQNSGTGAPGGNLQNLYVAFRGEGVYSSSNRGQTLKLMAGTTGDPLILNADGAPPQPVGVLSSASPFANGAATPNGAKGRIVLAKPALTGNLLDDILYQGWLYAADVSTPTQVTADNQHVAGGHLEGLYLTKDFGQNWTRVKLPDLGGGIPSNDSRLGDVDPLGVQTPAGVPVPHPLDLDNFGDGDYAFALAVDSANPNVVYLGGTSQFTGPGLIRVDTTGVSDAHSFYITNTDPEGKVAGNNLTVDAKGGQLRAYPNDPLPNNPQHDGITLSYGPGAPVAGLYSPIYNPTLNLIGDPQKPFVVGSTILTTDTSFFPNTGADAKWTPLDQALKPDTFNTNAADPWSKATTGLHTILTIKDTATGKTRLIFGDDNGVYTAVDQGNGQLLGSVGNVSNPADPTGDVAVVSGSRNGNLQIAQFNTEATQPSNAAALASQLQGFFYGNSVDNGTPNSNPNIIAVGQTGYGNTSWTRPNVVRSTGEGIAAVQTGPGQDGFGGVYRSLWPAGVDNGVDTDFFQLDQTSRVFNLLQNTAGQFDPAVGVNIADVPDGQWPFRLAFKFAVNPINGDQVVMSSLAGRVFRTENQGKFWSPIGEPAQLDGTNARALAFGAPDPNGPGGVGNQDSYILAGTAAGKVFVTFTGGGTANNSWTSISGGLDGSAIQSIATNPTPGTHEAYAVTQKGVYHLADTLAAGASWTSITGNLFNISKTLFGNATQVQTRLQNLTSLVADWRYIIPNNPALPDGPSHPILFAGGEGGVFRSTDAGVTWSLFPNADPATTGTLGDGGNLPNALVTDLQITLGQINPTTGRPDVSTGPNILTAATYGRGAFTIRLAPITFAASVQLDPNLPAPGGSDNGVSPTDKITSVLQPVFDGLSEQTAFGSAVTVQLIDQTDPANPVVIGAGLTDAAGRFQIQVVAGHFKADGSTDGVKTIGVQAIDQSGTKGNIVLFTFTLATTAPPALPAPDLEASSDSGLSNTDNITSVTSPVFDVSSVVAGDTAQLLRKLATAPNSAYAVVGTRTGTGAITDAGPVTDGVYTYADRQLDPAGNVGPISPSLTVTIDTVAPVATIAPDLEAGSDSGPSNTDNYTNVTNPIFDLVATEATATLTLLRKLASAPASSFVAVGQVVGTGAVNDAGPVPDGVYTYVAQQTDVAGNVGPLGPALTVTIDTIAPLASSIPRLTPASDSGASNTDNYTNVTTPVFTVASAETTATVRLIRDNVIVASRVGSGAITDPGPLTDGIHLYASQQVDLAGNVGPISGSQAVTIDTAPPVAGGVPDLEAGSDSGPSNTDNITSVVNPIFDVAPAEATATVQLLRKVDGSAASTYVVVGSRVGPGAVQDPGPVPAGFWDYASRQVDLAGNVGPISGFLLVQELTAPPGAPIAPDLEAGSDSGASNIDNYTNVTAPIFDVVATAPGVTVQLLRKLSSGGAFAVVASISGSGAVTDPGPVADGVYLYAAQEVDGAGNVSPIGAALTVTIDTTAPIAAGVPDLQSGSDSGPSNTDNITNVTSPIFDVAPAEATATLQLLRAGIVVATRTGPGAIQDPGPLAQGTYLYTSRQVDLAGNIGPVSTTSLSVTILTTVGVPGVPDLEAGSDSGISNTDNITNVTSPIFDIAPAAATATVSLLRNGVAVASRVGPGPIQDPGPLADGVYQYTAMQVDLAGNVGLASAALAVTITTTAPAAPGAPDLEAASDTGVSNTDNNTAATAPVFDVTPALAGDTVQLLRNGVVVATRVGPGAITDAGPVPDGVYSYTARQVDLAGNLSPQSGPLAVTIDTTAPTAPGVPHLQAASDTGASSTDNYTAATSPVFDVAPAEPAAAVNLYRDGTLVATRTGPGPLTDAGPVPDGVHQYTTRQVDLAGNVGPLSALLAVTIDTIAPVAAGVPDLQAASDSGISNTDNITNVNSPTFDVAPAEATATLQLLRRVDGTTTYSVVATRTGPGAIRDPGPAADGTYDYASRQVDLAGNVGPTSGFLAVQVLTVPPPVVTAPDLEAGSDSGPSNTDNITSVTNPIFDVAGVQALATLQLFRNSVLVASLNGTAGGTIAIQDPGPLTNGVYLYTARQVDQAGNAGPVSGSLQVTIVANGPTFVPGTPDLEAASDSGPSNTDNYTNVTSPVFDVAPVEPGVAFQLLRDNVVVGTHIGSGSVKDVGPVPDGVHLYTAREVDSAGNVGPSSPALSVTIDTVVSPPGAPDLEAASDSGVSNTDNVTKVTSPVFDIVPAEAGALVRLLRNGILVGTRTGPGAIQDPGPLSDGVYLYTATQTDLAGNVGTAGASLSVTIDTVAPTAASAPDLEATSDTGISNTDNVTSAKSPVFDVLTAEATATVQLLRNGVVVGTRVGPGPITDAGPVPDGFFSYTAVQVDVAGNVGPGSPSLGVTIDSIAPTVPSVPDLEPGSDSGISNTDNITNATTPLLDVFAAEPAATVQLFANGTLVGSRVGPGAIAVGTTLTDGVYAFNARQVDPAGNVGPLGGSLSVTIDTRPPGIPTLTLDPNSDTGVKGDGITSIRLPQFLGNADLGSTVQLIDNAGHILGLTTASAVDGTFAVTPISPLADGPYSLQSVALDAAGNKSIGSVVLKLTISGTLPSVPTIGLLAADDTGIPADGVTNVNRPHLIGVTDAGIRVDLLNAADVVVGTGTSSVTDGTYSIQPTAPFADGTQTLKVRATNLAGGQSTSAALAVTIDTVAPTAPVFALLPADDTGVLGDNITANRHARFFGLSEKLATVQLLTADGTVIAQNTTPLVDANFVLQPTVSLPVGRYVVRSRAIDAAGNVGPIGAPLTLTIIRVAGDYDGDGKADLVSYNRLNSQWTITESSGPVITLFFGQPGTDVPVSGDFDGDGKADVAVYRPSTGQWFILRSTAGPEVVNFGQPGVDIPVPGDFDGDGQTDLAVYRPTTGQWLILQSTLGPKVASFGAPSTDKPLVADFDGDGKTDLAVFRPSTGQWLISQSTAGPRVASFGATTDVPVPADYDGDGKADLAVYRPTSGQWFIQQSTAGPKAVSFGQPNVDIPVPQDLDGDGKTDIAVFRPTTAQWFSNNSTTGPSVRISGSISNIPVPSPYDYRKVSRTIINSVGGASAASLDFGGLAAGFNAPGAALVAGPKAYAAAPTKFHHVVAARRPAQVRANGRRHRHETDGV